MGEFDGMTVAVSGSASGIGRATADLFGETGADVIGLDVAEHDVAHGRSIRCDLVDPASVAAAFNRIASEVTCLDVLVNNAGVGAVGTIDDTTDDTFRSVFEVNVFGTARVTRAALPLLRRSSHGAIVNVSSLAAIRGIRQRAVYSASKGAVEALTRSMAADLQPEGIRVNAVLPGATDTPWLGRLEEDSSDARALLAARQPGGRLLDPAEIARAVAYLASPLAASATGVSLSVDGGVGSVIDTGTSPADTAIDDVSPSNPHVQQDSR